MDWFYKYFSLTAIIGGLWLLIRYLIQKKIDSYFNTKLEDHKKELAIITEQAKYDISKKLFDFEAYASKKHAVYPELYSLASEPWMEISSFRYNFDVDVRTPMRDFDDDEIVSYFYEKIAPIRAKISDGYDYLFKNELYLSKGVSQAYKETLYALSMFIIKIENTFHRNRMNINWEDPDFWFIEVDEGDAAKPAEKVHILKEIIYKELSYTHSEEI